MTFRHDIWPFIVWTLLRIDIRKSDTKACKESADETTKEPKP